MTVDASNGTREPDLGSLALRALILGEAERQRGPQWAPLGRFQGLERHLGRIPGPFRQAKSRQRPEMLKKGSKNWQEVSFTHNKNW